MQFCPQCDNVMDIGKSIPKVNLLQKAPTTVSTTSVSQSQPQEDIVDKIINAYKNKDNISSMKVDIDDLTSHPNFTKLKEQDKMKILKLLNLDNIDDNKIAYQICKNCLYHEKLTKRTLILSRMNLNSSGSATANLSKYKNMVHDKTLPHTRDYVCKNKDCSSHKDSSKRDAVWFRPVANSYSTYYGCTACETVWNIS